MHVRRALALATAVPLFLAGCGGGDPSDEPTPIMPDPTSPSATPTETPTGPPSAPSEMDRDDRAGAKAFVSYYFTLVNHAAATGEVTDLRKVALKSCVTCENLIGLIQDTHKNGGSIEGGVLDATRIQLSELSSTEGQRIFRGSSTVTNTSQVISNSGVDGLDGNYPASSKAYSVMVIHDKGGWHFAEWKSL